MLTKKIVIAVTWICTLFFLVSTSYAEGDIARGKVLHFECIDCHGEDGLGNEEYPKISGLEEAYIFEQLMAFKDGERPNRAEMMLWAMEDLEEQDLADLAAYYAFQEGD